MAHKIIQDFRERRNAKKWKHENGGSVHKPNGHRSVLDNGWINTKELKKRRKLVSFNQSGNIFKRLDIKD